MTTYGNPARISVSTTGGGIAAVDIATAEKVVVFARGDPSSGSANVNDPTQVSGPGELPGTFGNDTDMEFYMRQAAGNGISYSLLWGVMPATQAVSGEAIAGGSGGLSHTPIIEDAAEVTVQNTAAGQEETPVFRYESPPNTADISSDEVAINPYSGIVQAGDSDNYEIDYKYLEWQDAFDSAVDVIQEQETGVWYVGKDSEELANDAIATADPLRTGQWKMIKVQTPAEPNASTDDHYALIDAGSYSDSLDHDALFVPGPTRLEGEVRTVGGGIAGIMAGNAIDNPTLGDAVSGAGTLQQTMPVPDQETLEGEGVIPVSGSGAPSLESNVSSSTETDWLRTFFARRLADRLILAARAIGKASRGELNHPEIHSLIEEQLGDEIVELIDQGVLRPNPGDETEESRWFVEAEADPNNPRVVDVSFGFTPVGVIDAITFQQTINY